MIETMKWFGLPFLLLLGFTEGQNGGIDPQCNIIAEEVLQLKQPLIAQLKTFDADAKFWYVWNDFFNDDGHCLLYLFCRYYDYNRYKTEFRKLVKPFQVKEDILNAKLNVTGIISSQGLKLQQFEERKLEILRRYLVSYSVKDNPFLIFDSRFDNYDGLANASRCEPCTDADNFSSCLYKELNEIKVGLAIYEEVAVYDKKYPLIINDTIDLLTKEFTNITLTNEQIFEFYKNTILLRENNRYVSDVESRYGWYLNNTIKKSVNKFIELVQTILEPACIQNTCVGNVLKDVVTQIKPYLTPIAKTLPAWNFDVIVSSYVKPKNQTDINLIERFEEGFADYRDSVFPPYPNDYSYNGYNNMINPYSDHISSIINKGFTDLKKCPDFGLVYGISNFRNFVDAGTKGAYAQAYVMDYTITYDAYDLTDQL